jgi:hypothetical protein
MKSQNRPVSRTGPSDRLIQSERLRQTSHPVKITTARPTFSLAFVCRIYLRRRGTGTTVERRRILLPKFLAQNLGNSRS